MSSIQRDPRNPGPTGTSGGEWTRVTAGFRKQIVGGMVIAATLGGCMARQASLKEARVQRYEERMAEDPFEPAPTLDVIDRPAPVELVGPIQPGEMTLGAATWLHLPDPSVAPQVLDERLRAGAYSESIQSEYAEVYKQTKANIAQIERPGRQFRLTLADALRRALANNFQIRLDGYAPAISTAQIVQAEAAFDVVFFANITRNNTDQPTPSALLASQTDTTVVSGGISKLLATGATVTLTEAMTRVDNPGFQFQLLNPSWIHNFIVELRQPLLRNFGVDFNRAQINIRKNERKINEEAFRARVIEILNSTESAYWVLVAARRDVVISAELLAQAKFTYEQMKARIIFDVYKSLVFRSEQNVKQREFEYIDVKNRVRNAEDQLLNLLNDPELPLSSDLEIIPDDEPTTVEIIRDRYQAVQAALEHRPEIRQARYVVDNARINLGIAKNQTLPQLDVIYRATFNGLGPSSDEAFDEMTGGNFIDQFVGLEFAWSFGDRLGRAGIRVAALQQSQAVLGYKQALDNVITDCRVALRNLATSFEQITPSYKGVMAAAENLRSLQERQERKSPESLETILNAQTALAQSRRALLQALAAYNQGIVDVERAKGTLLEYDNVVLAEQP